MSAIHQRLFYITRSHPDANNSGGGALVRKAAIDLLKSYYDVWVVMPNYNTDELTVDNDAKKIVVPTSKKLKLLSHLESLGVVEDYLNSWYQRTFKVLLPLIKETDILFATSGGELSTLKLASHIAKQKGCKYVANLHDPIMFSHILGEKIYHPSVRFKMANRDKYVHKYLDNTDAIITSSATYLSSLKQQYPEWSKKLFNNHFGYIKEAEIAHHETKDSNASIVFVYGGNMGATQAPEILAKSVSDMENVSAHFIGDYSKNKYLSSHPKNVVLSKSLPYEKYNELVSKNADIGFTSLTGVFSKACVPSKIYEYINLGLPILGVFEDSDAKDIINNNHYGIACSNNKEELTQAINQFRDPNFRRKCRTNIIKDKPLWAMKNKITEVVEIINSL